MPREISDEILNYILDNADSMISIINNDLKYEKVNELFCNRFNKKKDDLIGKSPSEIWGEKTFREKIRENIERSLKGEEVQYRAYFDVTSTSGRFYEVTYKPFKSHKSRLSYAIVETRDITKEERHKEEIEEQKQKFHFIEEYLPFGIYACTRDGLITNANNTFYNILEIDKKEAAEININNYIISDYRFSQYLKTGTPGEAGTFSQVELRTDSGREIYVRISCHIRHDTEHQIIIDSVLEDITREVVLERRLFQSHRLETLGTLAGGVAHDFNTILATISGYSEMTMEEVKNNSVIYGYMLKMRSAIQKAEGIIDQMLIFSKQMDQHVVELEVEKVLEEAVDFVKSSVPDNIKVSTSISKTNGLINADPTQLFRVFLNIMTNAVQAMESKGGELKVCLSSSSTDNQRYANISVSDTGEGIEKEVMDRIFEPFFTTKEVDRGTGMGLAVAHGIITGINGEINVKSKPGEGSVFTVRIPLRDNQSSDTSIKTNRFERVIFAHDNHHLSRTISLALEKMNYNLTVVSSGKDLYRILKNDLNNYDLLFISSNFIDDNIISLLNKANENDKQDRIIIIRKKDFIIQTTDTFNISDYSYISEPITLKDILNEII